MSINLNCSPAQFALLKKRDDNFGENILQYLYITDETEPSQTYIIIYNYLIKFASEWFKKIQERGWDWKHQHRLIFEMDGLFRTYFYFLEKHPLNDNIIIDDRWKEIAKNAYIYIHSFWSESYGIDWSKLNKALLVCDKLSKKTIYRNDNNNNNNNNDYKVIQYSSDNNVSSYNVII